MPVKADNKAVLRDDRNVDCIVLSILANGRASIERWRLTHRASVREVLFGERRCRKADLANIADFAVPAVTGGNELEWCFAVDGVCESLAPAHVA